MATKPKIIIKLRMKKICNFHNNKNHLFIIIKYSFIFQTYPIIISNNLLELFLAHTKK